MPERLYARNVPDRLARFSIHSFAGLAGILQPGAQLLMRLPAPIRKTLLLVALCVVASGVLTAQELLDRIVARLENDVILLSDVRLLSRYQLLVEGKAESD